MHLHLPVAVAKVKLAEELGTCDIVSCLGMGVTVGRVERVGADGAISVIVDGAGSHKSVAAAAHHHTTRL